MLDQQGPADHPQDSRPPAGRPATPGEPRRKGLERIEHRRHPVLVTRQSHALGQGVGDDQEMLGGGGAQLDGAGGSDHLLLVRANENLGGLVLHFGLGLGDARGKALQGLGFLRLVQAEQHRHAIAEQHHHPAFADFEGERRRGDRPIGLHRQTTDPLAQQDRVGP